MPITGSARSPDSRRGLVSRAVKSTVPGIGIECRPASGAVVQCTTAHTTTSHPVRVCRELSPQFSRIKD